MNSLITCSISSEPTTIVETAYTRQRLLGWLGITAESQRQDEQEEVFLDTDEEAYLNTLLNREEGRELEKARQENLQDELDLDILLDRERAR